MRGAARHIIYLVLIAILTPLLVSCDVSATLTDSGGRISYATDINPLEWRDVAIITIPNHDTISRRSLTLFVRHQPQERLDSLNLKIFTLSPDEAIIEEYFTMPLDNNKYKRRNATQISEMTLHRNAVLGQKGEYKMYVFPAAKIKGIEAIGVSINRNK